MKAQRRYCRRKRADAVLKALKAIKRKNPNTETRYNAKTWANKVMSRLSRFLDTDKHLLLELRTGDSVVGKLTGIDWDNYKITMTGQVEGETTELPIPAVAVKKYYEIETSKDNPDQESEAGALQRAADP